MVRRRTALGGCLFSFVCVCVWVTLRNKKADTLMRGSRSLDPDALTASTIRWMRHLLGIVARRASRNEFAGLEMRNTPRLRGERPGPALANRLPCRAMLERGKMAGSRIGTGVRWQSDDTAGLSTTQHHLGSSSALCGHARRCVEPTQTSPALWIFCNVQGSRTILL